MNERLALFRTDAIRRRDQQFLGTSVLTTPVSFKVLCATAAAIALAAVGLLCFGHYTRKAVLTGRLLPKQGLIQVQSPQAGLVRRRLVTEGQSVKRGDVLFVLSSQRESATRGDTEAEISRQIALRRDHLRCGTS
jgi:membrane fusion protein